MAKPGNLQLMLSNFLRVLQDAGAPPIDSTSVNAVHRLIYPVSSDRQAWGRTICTWPPQNLNVWSWSGVTENVKNVLSR